MASTASGSFDEEQYFHLSMALLRSLQGNHLSKAVETAEAMRDMMGGTLPAGSPAHVLLELKEELAATKTDEEDEEEEETSTSTGSSSETGEGSEEEDEEESGEEDSKSFEEEEEEEDAGPMRKRVIVGSSGMRAASDAPVVTVADELRVVLSMLPPVASLVSTDRGDSPTTTMTTAATARTEVAGASDLHTSKGDGGIADDDDLTEEERTILAQIDSDVSRRMQRLATIRKNR